MPRSRITEMLFGLIEFYTLLRGRMVGQWFYYVGSTFRGKIESAACRQPELMEKVMVNWDLQRARNCGVADESVTNGNMK
ncbi:hypothetical protein WA026_013006 [Henosepilachna vigintioctopunctata]|uniref:Uncharacterized protein n=1 Tax=Henosepilachna vigintioctopunctata TaxID=420089 RepID=A0AAW1TUX6_9CUCU